MVRVKLGQKLVFLVPILLGVSAGITGLYLLAALALAALFLILGFMPSIKGYRNIFQFFFSFLTCLPINLRVSIDFFITLNDGESSIVLLVGWAAIFSFILISVELIVLGIISYLIWGEQDDALFAEKEKDAEMEAERRFRTKREKEILSTLRQKNIAIDYDNENETYCV